MMEQLSTTFSTIEPPNSTEISEGNEEISMARPMLCVKDMHFCPYPQCKFSSAWKSSLSMHLKTHTNERPWKCALCNKHFKLKHHLKHHSLTHSQHKPFKCNLCDYRSSDTHNLYRHKINKHRLPLKQKTASKRLSLPTMVSSQDVFASSSTAMLNTFLEHGHSFSNHVSESTTAKCQSPNTAAVDNVSSATSSFSCLGDVLLLKNTASLSSTGGMKIMNIRSVSDSVCSPPGYKTSQDSDSAVDFSQEADKSVDMPSMSSPESLLFTMKQETSHDTDGLGLSLRKTPNSQKSFDYMHSGRKSTDSLITKSPPLSQHVAGDDASQRNDLPVFDHNLENSMSQSQNARKVGSEGSDLVYEKRNTSIWKCVHCNIIFPDNIMYGLHMGCHSVGYPYQCNICGMKCKDSHDFMFHFTIGKHLR